MQRIKAMNRNNLSRIAILSFLIGLLFPPGGIAAGEIRERVYLQTDKDFYLSGENLWLKMYVTDTAGLPSHFSRIGYAELLGPKGAEAQCKLALQAGSGWGRLLLPPTLPSGCYRLTGYTRQMRNEGEAVYFARTIRIYNAWIASPDDRVVEVSAAGVDKEPATAPDTAFDTGFAIAPAAGAASDTEGQTGAHASRTPQAEAGAGTVFLPSSPFSVRISSDSARYATRSLIRIRIEGAPEGADLGLSVVRIDSLPAPEPYTIGHWRGQLARQPLPPLADTFLAEYEGALVTGLLLPATGTGNPAKTVANQPDATDTPQTNANQTAATATLPTAARKAGTDNAHAARQEALPNGLSAALSVPGSRIRLFSGQIGPENQVCFYTDALYGIQEVVAIAESPASTPYRIDLQSGFAPHTPVKLPPLALSAQNETALLLHSMALQTQYLFSPDGQGAAAATSRAASGNAETDTEIPATAQAAVLSDAVEREDGYGPRFAPTRTYRLDEYIRFKTVEQTFTEFIVGAQIRKIGKQSRFCVRKEEKQGFNDGNTLVLLDGIPLADHEVMLRYNPYRLSRIDIYNGTYVFGNRMYEGIVAFYTPRHRFPELRLPSGMQLLDYKGTTARESLRGKAYADEKERASRLPDFRHTLYWNPALKSTATAIETECYASDLEGYFLITVEGLGPDGQPLRAEHVICIQK